MAGHRRITYLVLLDLAAIEDHLAAAARGASERSPALEPGRGGPAPSQPAIEGGLVRC